MSTIQNYTNGQIAIYGDICFESWLLLPGQLLWSKYVLGAFYVVAILYLFLGIAICADTFMLSIEMITSKKRIIFTYDRERNERVEREVFVWNETIANLTLMALGSSAPEILISVFETLATLSDTKPKESLGLFTIIGSAAYNLIVITAICVMAVPTGTSKKVSEFGVFLVTSFWSIFAYVWLIFVVRWSSANEIELWEAILTLLFFPLLVISAWMQDKGCWLHKCKKNKLNKHITELHRIEENNAELDVRFQCNDELNSDCNHKLSFTNHSPSHKISYNDIKLRKITTHSQHESTDTQPGHKLPETRNVITTNKAFARARFRHTVVLSITGKTKMAEDYEKSIKKETNMQKQLKNQELSKSQESKSKPFPLIFGESKLIGNFCFSSSTYAVSRGSKYLRVNVLLNRRKKKNEKVIGFSHVVEAARKQSWMNLRNAIESNTVQNGDLNHNDNKNESEIQHSYHAPASIRDSLPDVEIGETSDSSIIQNKNALSAAVKYSVNRSMNDLRNCDIQNHNLLVTSNSDSVRRSTDWELLDLKNTSLVSYETREGKAKLGVDIVQNSGTLVFKSNEFSKTIEIKLSDEAHQSPSKKKHSDEECLDFYIVLKDPCHDTSLGDPSIAHVSIIDDNEPGVFIFQDATAFVQYKLFNVSIVTATVVRIQGSDGAASVYYRTINGTAIGGDEEDIRHGNSDYERIEDGVLTFSSGETSKKIMIKTNPEADKTRTFIIALHHSTGGSKIGHRCATIVSLTSEMDEIVEQVTTLSNESENKTVLSNRQEYRKQFKEAMSLDEEASQIDMFLHILCFGWKIIFALIPPRTIWGGWATFVVSLLMLGVLAALVEQYAKLFGCILGLHVSVTGITLVALGTSMPDTFASKTAALQDDTADAAIGNITGSNSVNVFLGLGLPWVIKAAYLATQGSTVSLQADELLFSVLVFLSCGLVTLSILVLRRMLEGGELGGFFISKYLSGFSMILLWFVFVTCTALQAYGIIHLDHL